MDTLVIAKNVIKLDHATITAKNMGYKNKRKLRRHWILFKKKKTLHMVLALFAIPIGGVAIGIGLVTGDWLLIAVGVIGAMVNFYFL